MMPRRHRTLKPSAYQRKYLRYLQRACDLPPTTPTSRYDAHLEITEAEQSYRIVFGRQPAMRGR